jgi:hypothetical protein
MEHSILELISCNFMHFIRMDGWLQLVSPYHLSFSDFAALCISNNFLLFLYFSLISKSYKENNWFAGVTLQAYIHQKKLNIKILSKLNPVQVKTIISIHKALYSIS